MIVDVLTCCLSPLFPFSLSLTVRACVRVFSDSQANYFRGRPGLCGCAALHVWQTASATLCCERDAPAKHHLALGAVLRPHTYKVSHRPARMFALDYLHSCSVNFL